MKMKLSRLLCLVLCAAMVCCLLPTTALAADTAPDGFANFDELKALSAGTYEGMPYIPYTGEDTLTITEDLSIPSNVMIEVGNTVIIPEGVTLTVSSGSQLYCSALTVEGTLVNNGVYMETYDSLTVANTGRIENNAPLSIPVESEIADGSITCGENGQIWKFKYVDNAADVYEVADIAAADDSADVTYELFISQRSADPIVVLTESLTIPGNTGIYVSKGGSLTIGEGCDLTLYGSIYTTSTVFVGGTLKNYGSLGLGSFYSSSEGAYVSGTLTVVEIGSYTGDGMFYVEIGDRTDVTDAVIGLELSDFSISEDENQWYLTPIMESGDLTFETFEELKALAAGSYGSFAYAEYVGSGAITIEEDLTIPANLAAAIYDEVVIPSGVTLTLDSGSHLYCNNLDVAGTLIHDGEYMEVMDQVSVTGSMEVNSTLYTLVDSGADMDRITFGEYAQMFKYQYANSADDIYGIVEIADEESHPHVSYELYITRASANPNMVLTDSVTIPGNTTILVNQGASLTISEGCTVTLDGLINSRSEIIVNGTLETNGCLLLNSLYIDASYYSGTLTMADSGSYTGSGTMEVVKGNRSSLEEAITGLELSRFDISDNGMVWTLVLTSEPSVSFTDVLSGQYYSDAIEWAVQNGITTGLSATKFGVDANCTRAQFVTFLWRAAGCPAPASSENPFTDVEEGQFYTDAVLWAVEQGYTTGLSATKFGVNENCTRDQVVTFLWRFAGKPAPTSSNNPFTDVLPGQFYSDAILWAVENGITNGVNASTFGVGAACNRAMVVTFLYRAIAE